MEAKPKEYNIQQIPRASDQPPIRLHMIAQGHPCLLQNRHKAVPVNQLFIYLLLYSHTVSKTAKTFSGGISGWML